MIQSLIEKMKQELVDDAEHKAYCDAELAKNEQVRWQFLNTSFARDWRAFKLSRGNHQRGARARTSLPVEALIRA